MVARPAVLYIHDVPILWLPFIFQDVRPGRRSGMLSPRFGVNDLVRPTRSYARHFANLGYFVAINNQQAGPFDMSALQQKVRDGSLTRSSLVWKQGMSGWVAADTVPELQSLFAALPPPLPNP